MVAERVSSLLRFVEAHEGFASGCPSRDVRSLMVRSHDRPWPVMRRFALPQEIIDEIRDARGRLTMSEVAARYGIRRQRVGHIWRARRPVRSKCA